MTTDHDVRLVRYLDLLPAMVGDQIDAIFFEASAVKTFASDDKRCAFHWRWLGRYLNHEPEHAFVALSGGDEVCGYLVGSIADPAQRSEFNELEYFATFAELTRQYPAHLHLNVHADYRSQGIGARLIATFARHARAEGAPGMHIVTGKGMRNVDFYARLGFRELAVTARGGGAAVLMGRRL